MRPYFIYAIENILSNKIYVGQTVDMSARWNKHKSDIGKQKLPLYFALAKYGVENFIFYMLEITTIDHVDEREVYWISYFKSVDSNFGYNIALGGHKNKVCSESTRQKFRDLKLGTHQSDEIKKKIGDANRGKKRDEEFCKQRSLLSKGKIPSPETRSKMSEAHLGKTSSLNVDSVLDIRTKFASGLFTKRQLAEMYGITFQSVSQIIRRKTWKHI